jgi:hypothetical protein
VQRSAARWGEIRNARSPAVAAAQTTSKGSAGGAPAARADCKKLENLRRGTSLREAGLWGAPGPPTGSAPRAEMSCEACRAARNAATASRLLGFLQFEPDGALERQEDGRYVAEVRGWTCST